MNGWKPYRTKTTANYHKSYRIATTVVNIALLLSFVLTAFCGMSMSSHAVPFLYGMTKVSFARRMHLSMSHWAFVLMGLHLGMHIPVMFAKLKLTDKGNITARSAGRLFWMISLKKNRG